MPPTHLYRAAVAAAPQLLESIGAIRELAAAGLEVLRRHLAPDHQRQPRLVGGVVAGQQLADLAVLPRHLLLPLVPQPHVHVPDVGAAHVEQVHLLQQRQQQQEAAGQEGSGRGRRSEQQWEGSAGWDGGTMYSSQHSYASFISSVGQYAQ